jgi:hypothetical protein
MTNPYLYYIIIRHVIGLCVLSPRKCFTLCIFLCSYVVGECSCMSVFPCGRGHPSAWARGCSQTSGECTSTRTSPYLNNSLFISSCLSHFIKEKYFHGNMGTYTIGGAPWHNALGFFCWGRSLKIHREIKREFFTLSGSPSVGGSLKTYS